jgi:TetR/AcrR family transcriptional regulator, transcriptional repressor for nem operon
MPRVSREQAAANRAAIVRAASELLRERGPAAVTVDAVSERAGLTHGGFYKQFASKDALLDEALAYAVDQRRQAVDAAVEERPDAAAALREWYLSAEHRDDPASGCAVAALSGIVATEPDGPLHDGFRGALDDLLGAVERLRPERADGDAALADVALMVGALALARSTAGSAMSERILAAARERLGATR